jgi:hypothetical protein
MKDMLSAYMGSGHKKVQGWLSPIGLNVIAQLASIQKEIGIVGAVSEIGVHHGRLFILLHLLSDQSEKSVAWDLFERQEENVDKSGNGNRSILVENLRKNGCDLERIKIFSENSMDLTVEAVLEACEGKLRLFSIDGGHTAEITYNDLSLARQTLSDGGLIILDDFFHEAWPGVAEGTCRYMREHDNALFPVIIAGNKYIFTNNECAAKIYIDRLDKTQKGHYPKRSCVFGKEVLILLPITTIRNAVTQNKAWKNIRDKPLGLFLRRFVRR